jgi:hypothetical protein
MRRYIPDRMKSAGLFLLVFDSDVAQNTDERFGFVMSSFERAPAWQWG